MSEVVNVLVAVAVIVFVARWATSGKDATADSQSPAAILGFRPNNVSQEQIDMVHNMFPDVPRDNIRYDLLRTGSVQLTSNKVLERGFLPPPPAAYYTIYPRQEAEQARAAPAPVDGTPVPTSTPKQNLITRMNLQDRVIEPGVSSGTEPVQKWEESAEKREANLRERKARMVLAARERMLAQQRKL